MTKVQFNLYYKNNVIALRNFARKLANSSADAEDLFQEATLKAFRGMHTFKQGNSFKSWAFTILKNTFVTKYHKRKKRNMVSTAVEDLAFAIDVQHSIRNNALSNIRLQEIYDCIEDLSGKSKRPFLMYVNGYQYNEIADALHIPIGTVKSRINYARTKLKSALSNKGIYQAA